MEVQDTNKDGLIQRADFDLILQRFKEMGASEKSLKEVKGTFESAYQSWGLVDDSTALTYDEFLSNFTREMQKIIDGIGKPLFTGPFNIIDVNGNGKISYKEWANYYAAIGIDTVHAKASFDAMDTDGDGVVSMEEFTAYTQEYYLSTENTLNSAIMYGPLD